MPEESLKTVIANIRTQMATDAANDNIPKFDKNNQGAAEAHVQYLNELVTDSRLPTFEVETVTYYKLKVNQPA